MAAASAKGHGNRRGKSRRALSLRATLVLIIVIISSIGLFGSSIAVHYAMRTVLLNQADEDLQVSATGWTQNPALYGSGAVYTPSEFSVLAITPYGQMYTMHGTPENQPDFSELVFNGQPQTVGSVEGSAEDVDWRAIGLVNDDGTLFIVAKSLESTQLILSGLDFVLVTINLMALLLMALIGAMFVQRALRPLREVESTARAIADGDINRRVPTWSPKTEVGQLSIALNRMLGQLQESLESAQRSSRAARSKEEQMRRFVGDASHELRTPLTSVRGYTELYRSGATDDADRVLDKIEDESGRMKLLVEDLLALTRAEGSRLDLRTVDLLEISLAAASSARAAHPGRTIGVVNETSAVPVVEGDADRLHQVLLNLINNGLKHGGEDATVTINLHRDHGANGETDHFLIDIIDDGRGMSDETTSHIFERFYREDSSRSRGSGGGSGLGLSIVRSLVEQHNGTIKVASKEGVGTTFRISLPPAADVAVPADRTEKTGGAGDAEQA